MADIVEALKLPLLIGAWLYLGLNILGAAAATTLFGVLFYKFIKGKI
jgi:hypothetical protein